MGDGARGGAAAGGSLSSLIQPDVLQLLASVGFLILGSRLILRSSRGGNGEDGETPTP